VKRGPGRPPGSSKKKHGQVDESFTDLVTIFTKSVFDVMALPLGSQWQISIDEAKSIAEPGARILNKLGGGELAEKYGDYIALTLALSMVTAPRVIMTKQLKKHKEGVVKFERKRPPENNAGNAPVQDGGQFGNDGGNVKNILQVWLDRMTNKEVIDLCNSIRESLEYVESGEKTGE
jgi:hypothetical protein